MDVGIAAALITGGISLAGNIAFSAWRSGKQEGALVQAVQTLTQGQKELRDEQQRQWQHIGDNAKSISRIEGRLGKANGHGASL